jgi:PadR family transcriptional regulator
LILKAVSLKPLHGYGVLLRIQQISGQVPSVPQKYYTLTTLGRRRLREEARLELVANAIVAAMRTTPEV